MQQGTTGVNNFIIALGQLYVVQIKRSFRKSWEECGGEIPALRVLSTEVRDDVENSGVGALGVIL